MYKCSRIKISDSDVQDCPIKLQFTLGLQYKYDVYQDN